jgi:predicted alpha/beta superfamily hydrolase
MNKYNREQAAGRNLLIYLPPSYHTSPEVHYPVAYIQDGGELFDSCLNQLEHLFFQGKLQELILVGVESSNRNHDYTPWPAAALLEGKPSLDGEGRLYVNELADVIKPYIDGLYRTRPGAEDTAVIGGSLGALIAMFAGYWRPEVFGRLGLISPSFWYEGVLHYVEEQPALAAHLRVFMSVGSFEGIYKNNAQQNMVSYTKQAHELWRVKDGDARRLRFVLAEGDTHDLHCMTKRFPEALAWLFPIVSPLPMEKMAAFMIPGTNAWIMHAERTGREYRIFTYVPAGQPPEEGFPIIYSLDGNASFSSLAEAMRLQSRPPHGFEPAIIVGIGYESDDPIVTGPRFYDYTEKADPVKLPARPSRTEWPETGGADAFLAFIEEELKPALERMFPIDRTRQALFGHSLGGWFTLHVLAERPEAFSTYIAGSPSVWWNGAIILDRLPSSLQRLRQVGELSAISLYIGVGSGEKPSMVADSERLHELLKPYEAEGLRLQYRAFEGEGHVSVIHPMISDMLRFFLRKEEV